MKRYPFFSIAIAILIVAGCTGAGERLPVAPDCRSTISSDPSGDAGPQRYLLGLWDIRISSDHRTVDVVPDRTASMHMNMVSVLEEDTCTDCLVFETVNNLPGNVLRANLKIRHPYPDNLNLTMFDARGIFISGAKYTFPLSTRSITWGADTTRLLNADGYTLLFNPTEYPEGSWPTPLLTYVQGHYAPGGDMSATLNPYVAYNLDQPRCIFEAGSICERTLLLGLPDGDAEFGYAIDACWKEVAGEVTDPIKDFPPDANCLEPYALEAWIDTEQDLSSGGSAKVFVKVFDHQGVSSVSLVTAEAPDLFAGEVELSWVPTTKGGPSWLFAGTISNELGASDGDYPLLLRIRDIFPDENLGQIDAFQVVTVRVGNNAGWTRAWGRGYDLSAHGIALDSYGDIHIAGTFNGVMDFDPGPGIRQIDSGFQMSGPFMASYNPAGLFRWADRNGPYCDGGNYGEGIAPDSSGYLYTTGRWVTLGLPVNGYGGFLHKRGRTGGLLWDKEPECYAYEVAVDHLGGVYVTGNDLPVSDAPVDAALCCFDPNGQLLWKRAWGGGVFCVGYGLAADDDDGVYVSGWFQGSVDFDPGPGEDIHTSADGDVFISKFDSSGGYQWVRTWRGYQYQQGQPLSIYAGGGIYTTGRFEDTVDFDPGPGIENHVSNGGQDIFLSKLNTSGDWEWTLAWGGPEDDLAYSCATDVLGNAYVTGSFRGSTDFDPGPGSDIRDSNGQSDAFVTRFGSDGTYLGTLTWGGPDADDSGKAVVLDPTGNMYVSGWFMGVVDFNPGPGVDYQCSDISGGSASLTKVPFDWVW